MSSPQLDWTVMIYLAAPDKSLQVAAFELLFNDLPKIGSSDRVQIVLQMDTLGATPSRFVVNVKDQLPPLIPHPIPSASSTGTINTGSVEPFIDCVQFVKDNHEAKHYLVVLNGHGNGVVDFPENETAPVNVAPAATGAVGSAVGTGVLPVASPHAVLLDPPDALTSGEVKVAFERASRILGKIDIVGFDACLMSMIEIAMQIQESASLMVASEQTIPSKGWPYARIIKNLIDSPGIDAKALSQKIVDEFLAFYEEQKEHVMLAAWDLNKAQDLSDIIGSELVPQLRRCLTIPELRLILLKTRFDTLSFFDSDFLDLFNFCGHLIENLDDERFKSVKLTQPALCEDLATTCEKIKNQISDDGTGVVIKSDVTQRDISPIRDARGISIYLPLILPLYRELEFSKQTKWHDFLAEYMTTFFLPGGDALASSVKPNASSNGLKPNGGTTAMSSEQTNQVRTLCLVLDAGTTITDNATGLTKQITGMACLDMTPDPKIHVPIDTVVAEPGKPSVKASSGTELKASSGTELKGTAGAGGEQPLLEMVVPACTLREVTTSNPNTELSDGTKITATSSAPIVVVKEITVTAPLP